MGALSLDELLKTTTLRRREMDIDGLGTVRVRGLSVAELGDANECDSATDAGRAERIRRVIKYALADVGAELTDEQARAFARAHCAQVVGAIYEAAFELTVPEKSGIDAEGSLEKK